MKTTFMVLLTTAVCASGLSAADDQPFDLTTRLGETFHGCRIFKVTPQAVTVIHDHGVAKLDFKVLPGTWRDKYSYSPEKAAKYAKTEARRKREAEAQYKKYNKKRERAEDERMAILIAAEKESLAQAASPLLPFPGDEPEPAATDATVEVTTYDSGVPVLPPLTQVHTPNLDRIPRTRYSSGAYDYYPGNFGYAGYGPFYSYPGVFYPGNNGHGHCSPMRSGRQTSGIRGNIRWGSTAIRVNPGTR